AIRTRRRSGQRGRCARSTIAGRSPTRSERAAPRSALVELDRGAEVEIERRVTALGAAVGEVDRSDLRVDREEERTAEEGSGRRRAVEAAIDVAELERDAAVDRGAERLVEEDGATAIEHAREEELAADQLFVAVAGEVEQAAGP